MSRSSKRQAKNNIDSKAILTGRRLDDERGLGMEVGGEGDEQRGDGCGDECAAGFGVVASEHDCYLPIVWHFVLKVLFIVE